MNALPHDFDETLARVLEPGHEEAAARIIKEACRLDDSGLQVFLEMFAERVRTSETPVTASELQGFLQSASHARRRGRPAAR